MTSGQGVLGKRNWTIDPQEQVQILTKLPQIRGSKNTQANNRTVDQNRLKFNVSPRANVNSQATASMRSHNQAKENKVSKGNIWIVKPGENSNRGHGITVCSKLREIKSIISQSDYDKRKTFIVQKYIEKPALYRQRKFDIRCFAMLTLVNNKLKGFVYDNGYLRTSSRPFVNSNLNNKLIHLTNDAVQKNSDEYGRFESGNKLSFAEY